MKCAYSPSGPGIRRACVVLRAGHSTYHYKSRKVELEILGERICEMAATRQSNVKTRAASR
jgi:hypothetical protein